MTHTFSIKIAKKLYTVSTANSHLVREIQQEFITEKKPACASLRKIDLNVFFADQKITPTMHNGELVSISKIMGFMATGAIEAYALKNKTIFLHGSSFYYKTKGYIFVGPSGIGKSTLVNKIDREKRMSDDTCVVELRKGGWYLHRSPFDKRKIIHKSKMVKLASLFILQQAKHNALCDLKSTSKIKHLLKNDLLMMNRENFIYPKLFKDAPLKVARLIFSLAQKIPVQKLRCNKNLNLERFINIK